MMLKYFISRKPALKYVIRIFLLVIITGMISSRSPVASDHNLHLKVEDFRGKRAYLASVEGDNQEIVDSILVVDGEIHFLLNDSIPAGLYRVFFDDPRQPGRFNRDPVYVDVLFNHEDIKLRTNYNRPFEDMVVIESKENNKYFTFLSLKSGYRERLGMLLPLLEVYSREDDFFNSVHNELLRIQKAYNDSLVLLSDKDPEMISSSLISLYREPVYDPLKNPDLEEFLRDNYLDPIAFNDPRLINTPAITNKILSYLSFYRIPGANQAEQEDAFIDAVDRIMAEVSYNEKLYDFVLNYLIDGFEQFKMEKVLVHIADNHLTGECKTEDEEIVRERLDAYKRMAPGNKVADINLLDPYDNPHRLSDLESNVRLLVFWSSECPHCENLLPRLSKWYKEENERNIEIYSVSIDKSRADWEEFVILNDLDFINVYDPEGWESKTSRQYNLYATPTMFLLDREMKILAKPVTFREFRKELKRL